MTFESFSATGAGYAFSSERANLLERRLAYIQRHGAAFLFSNSPPPVPGYPRAKAVQPASFHRVSSTQTEWQKAQIAELVAQGSSITAAAKAIGKSGSRGSQLWLAICADLGWQAV
ncbi:hypothetical protein ACRAQ6_14050 [Erythrobacter sp. HA6-11]